MRRANFRRWFQIYLSGMVFLHLAMAWGTRDLIRKGYPDFTIFYSAGKIVGRGLGWNLYDPQTQYQIQREFAAEVSIRQGPLAYLHPPFEALVFVPFARLPYFSAYLLWDAINLLILFSLPLLLGFDLPFLRHRSALFWMIVSTAFFPVFVALLQGQDIIFLLLFFALTFKSLKNGRDLAGGAWLGLGLFRFHLVLPLLFVLLLRWRRKALLGFVAVAFALGLFSTAVVGWQGMKAYPGYVLRVENSLGRGAIVSADMPSFHGLIDAVLGTSVSPSSKTALVVLASAMLLIVATRLWKRANASEFDLCFSFCVATTVVVSYHSFIYDLSLLLLPILILLNRLPTILHADAWTRFAVLTPIAILFLSPLQIVLTMRYWRAGLLVPVLLLWMWGITRLLVRGNRSATHVPLTV